MAQNFGKGARIARLARWAIATLTTVGYGDVPPITGFGKLAAGITAIFGVGLVAMPAGILAAAFSEAIQKRKDKGDARDKPNSA